jgi:hypothetical protein
LMLAGFFGAGRRGLGSGFFGGGASWTPESPTSDGGVSPHTWHYAGSGALYQDSGKTTLATADGDPVGASVNRGSDSHDITQSTSANKPTYKTGVLNGEPVFRFDGGDWLGGAYNNALSQPITVFAVAALDSANDDVGRNIIDGDDSTNRMALFERRINNPDTWSIYAGSILDGGASDANWNIWTALFNGASSQFWLGGNSEASGNAGSDDPDGLRLGTYDGAAGLWDGDIAEILIYNSNLSTADKNEVAQYLADKYDLSYTDIT